MQWRRCGRLSTTDEGRGEVSKGITALGRLAVGIAGVAILALVVLGIGVAAVQTAPHWRGFLITIGVVVAGALVVAAVAARIGSPLPRRFILELDLREPVSDGTQGDLLAKLGGGPSPSLRDLL